MSGDPKFGDQSQGRYAYSADNASQCSFLEIERIFAAGSV
jgi:hypothetical protein